MPEKKMSKGSLTDRVRALESALKSLENQLKESINEIVEEVGMETSLWDIDEQSNKLRATDLGYLDDLDDESDGVDFVIVCTPKKGLKKLPDLYLKGKEWVEEDCDTYTLDQAHTKIDDESIEELPKRIRYKYNKPMVREA